MTTPAEPYLTEQIDPQTRAELERAYLTVRVTGNRLNGSQGKRKLRRIQGRFLAALRQFNFLVNQAQKSVEAANRRAA